MVRVIFSISITIVGITIRINTVLNANPKEILVAIGIKNCACNERSNNNGVNPAIVVNEVRITALSL